MKAAEKTQTLKNGIEPNEQALTAAAKQFGVAVPRTLTKLLGAVRVHVAGLLAAEPDDGKHLECPRCGEVSTDATDFCPFCGDQGDEAAAVAEVPAATEPAEVVEEAVDMQLLTDQLTTSISKIADLAQRFVVCSYDIGVELRTIRDAQLYKAKGYDSFTKFAASDELPMARETVHRLVSMTEKFTREQFSAVGMKKLRLIAEVKDDAERKQLVDAAPGKPTKELEREVKQAKDRSAPAAEPATAVVPTAEQVIREAPVPESSVSILGKATEEPFPIAFVTTKGKAVKYVADLQTHKSDCYAEFRIGDDVVVRIALDVDSKHRLVGLVGQIRKAGVKPVIRVKAWRGPLYWLALIGLSVTGWIGFYELAMDQLEETPKKPSDTGVTDPGNPYGLGPGGPGW